MQNKTTDHCNYLLKGLLMNRDILRQIIVIISVAATITVNILANALPFNGISTGAVSDQFKVYFVPAGYVFAIWGLIYIGMIAFAIYQALPAQRENPWLRKTGYWFALSGFFNSIWLFMWHYLMFPLTLVFMLGLLASLLVIYLQLEIGWRKVSAGEKWCVHIPVSTYLGWISVATIANFSDVLDFVKWNAWGIAPEVWTVIMLGAALTLGLLMIFIRKEIAYPAVLIWATIGIAFKQSAVPLVPSAAWIVVGLLVIGLAGKAGLALRKSAA
jgi:translocator protein